MIRFIKWIFGWGQGRTINTKTCKQYTCYVTKLEKKSPRAQIIDCDKIYHSILKDLGYSGSFGEILKRNPKEISNIQEVWDLHKLRNTLVHDLKEPDVNLQKNAEQYKKVIRGFLKRVSK